MSLELTIDFSALCVQKGIETAFICPGSRSAPLALAFFRNSKIKSFIVSDERSAGFMALGYAKATKKPVVIITTSGTATLNLAPAIAEAFHAHIPLLICTADRPAEWIGQQDGQAIDQQNLYGNKVAAFYQFPSQENHKEAKWYANRIGNEAINLLLKKYPKPVHINFPYREPFYPEENFSFEYKPQRLINEHFNSLKFNGNLLHSFVKTIEECPKVLIVLGQMDYNKDLIDALNALTYYTDIAVITEITSNAHLLNKSVQHSDWFLPALSNKEIATLEPELLITIGGSILSKNLKQLLRKFSPQHHWHIQEAGFVADAFQHLTDVVFTEPAHFITKIGEALFFKTPHFYASYAAHWHSIELKTKQTLDSLTITQESDIYFFKELLNIIPENIHLHLANSMSVRYANLSVLKNVYGVEVFCNRGTSGIDGCTSTCVGAALANPEREFWLLTGDMAFQYDINAFWHNYEVKNLKVIVFNNGGGNIFSMINGPAQLPEKRVLFETEQQQNAAFVKERFSLSYAAIHKSEDIARLKELLLSKEFYGIIEIFTSAEENVSVFNTLKHQLHSSISSILSNE